MKIQMLKLSITKGICKHLCLCLLKFKGKGQLVEVLYTGFLILFTPCDFALASTLTNDFAKTRIRPDSQLCFMRDNMRYWNSLSLTIRAKGVKIKWGHIFSCLQYFQIIFKFIHTITVVPGVKERPQHKGFNEFNRNAMYITQKFFQEQKSKSVIVRLLEDSLVKIKVLIIYCN